MKILFIYFTILLTSVSESLSTISNQLIASSVYSRIYKDDKMLKHALKSTILALNLLVDLRFLFRVLKS
jgi:hypothetical protein